MSGEYCTCTFWALFKRGSHGVYYWMSRKHLQRYINDFVGQHNLRDMEPLDQMRDVVCGLVEKRLMYRDPIAD